MFKISNNNQKEFNKNGVVVLRRFLPKSKASELQRKIDIYILKNKKKLKGKDINFIGSKVNSLHKIRGKYFEKLYKSKKVVESSRLLLNAIPKFKHCEYFAKPEKVGLPSPMHQDNYYWNLKNPNAITMWIALTPANKKNGSIDYLIGSHKIGKVKHISSYAPGSSQKVKNLKKFKKFKRRSFNLNIGDCLVHHSEIIHGSKANNSNYPRRGFTIQMIDSKAKIDKIALKNYKISLDKQIKRRS